MTDQLQTARYSLEDLLNQIVLRTREVIPFDSGGIAIYDPESGFLAPRSYSKYSDDAPLPRLLRLGEGIVGLAAQLREPLLIDDVMNDARYIPYDPETRSQIAVPIILQDNLLGVFSVESYTANVYTRQHLKTLYALADQAALALHTARLYDELARRYDRLNDYNEQLLLRNEISRMATSDHPIEELLPQMAERLARMVRADACALTLWDEKYGRARRLSAYGIDINEYLNGSGKSLDARSLTRDVVFRNQTIIINEAHRIDPPPSSLVVEYDAHGIMAMPLKARGRPIGATFLMNFTDERQFTQDDAEFVTSVLDQIALAIDNGFLLKDTQARLSETSILVEIAAIASSSLELDEMLAQVMRLSQRMLGVTAGAVLIYDRQTNFLTTRTGAAFGFSEELLQLRFPVNDPRSRISVVFNSGAGQFLNELQNNTHEHYRELAHRAALQNVLIVPLRVQDEPVGVFLVGGKPGDFSRTDLELLMAIGSHVAAALRNADLLDATRAQLRETRSLQEIAGITSATLDIDEMLRLVVIEAAELLDVEGAFIYLPDESNTLLIPHMESLYGVMGGVDMPVLGLSDRWHVAHVFNTGKPYISNELGSDPVLQQRSVITYPLVAHQRTLGVISMVNKRVGEFEDVHIELMRAAAAQLAISMENVGLLNAERRRADLMSMISRIGQELTATLDLPGLMRKVVRSIHTILGYDAVSVYLLDESGSIVTVQATAAHLPAMLLPEGFSFPITQGVTGRAIRSRKTQIVPNLRSDPDFFWPGQQLHNAASNIVVLLKNRERILGAVEIVSSRVGAFREPDTTAMETLSTQISTVIENARLWDQAQRRLLEQEIVHQIGQDLTSILDFGDLVNAVVRHMTRALDTALCLLVSYHSETGQLNVDAEYRPPEIASQPDHPIPRLIGQAPSNAEHALVTKALNSRRQVLRYIGDVDTPAAHHDYYVQSGITAVMAIPMVAGDRVIGAMVWIETRNPRKFSDSDVRLAQTLTTQAAIAIENARLYRQAQRQAREQAMLRRVAVSLSMLSSLGDLLDVFPREVAEAMNADNVVMSLRDNDNIFRVKSHVLATRAIHQMALGRIRREVPGLWNVLQKGLTAHQSSALPPETEAGIALQEIMEDQPGMLVIVPIMRRQEAIGMIEVCRDDPLALFDSQEISLIEALARQVSTAIDNISLYEREQFRLRQLEKVQMSGRVLSSQLNTERLLTMIVEEAARIFEAPAAALLVPMNDYYVFRASVGLSAEYIERRVASNPEHYRRETPIYIAEMVEAVPDQAQHPIIQHEDLRSVLSIPLSKGSYQFARLLIYSKTRIRHFSTEEVELAQLFAGQAAVAVDNARLFEELEERAIELSKANKLKSEFLARISHELRTPMNSINGYSEMLLRNTYGTLTEKQNDRLERILRNGRNLLALIDDLLDISKIDAGKMEMRIAPVNVAEELNAVMWAMESQAVAKGLYLRSELPDGLPHVRADAVRLKQVITNLFGNAIKFTKQGGVSVRARYWDDDTREMLAISVIDTGIGIRSEDQHIIFDEFRQADQSATREYGGTGLGLAITRKLIELMGGRIWVESEVEQGSTFTFILPIAT
jgi:GAF domain-containing protein/anti-sigma regulatory factor (Ser/Thr protein kinase)